MTTPIDYDQLLKYVQELDANYDMVQKAIAELEQFDSNGKDPAIIRAMITKHQGIINIARSRQTSIYQEIMNSYPL